MTTDRLRMLAADVAIVQYAMQSVHVIRDARLLSVKPRTEESCWLETFRAVVKAVITTAIRLRYDYDTTTTKN